MKTIEFIFQDDHIPSARIHAHIDDLDMLKQYCDRYSVDFDIAKILLRNYPNTTRIDFTQIKDEIITCSCIDCETGCSEACEICIPEKPQAMHVTRQNILECAQWAGARNVYSDVQGRWNFAIPTANGLVAREGDWVVLNSDESFGVWSNEAFTQEFDFPEEN